MAVDLWWWSITFYNLLFFVIELKMHHSSYFVLQHLNDLWLALCMLALIDLFIYLPLIYLFAFCLFPCIHLTHSDLGNPGCHKKCLKCLDLYNLFFFPILSDVQKTVQSVRLWYCAMDKNKNIQTNRLEQSVRVQTSIAWMEALCLKY